MVVEGASRDGESVGARLGGSKEISVKSVGAHALSDVRLRRGELDARSP